VFLFQQLERCSSLRRVVFDIGQDQRDFPEASKPNASSRVTALRTGQADPKIPCVARKNFLVGVHHQNARSHGIGHDRRRGGGVGKFQRNRHRFGHRSRMSWLSHGLAMKRNTSPSLIEPTIAAGSE